ncbi:MAG: site-2 protease family protein [Ardenticatenaceae bacterium]|nr:site-2 protease family protein [Ardenticatenaceae bacterium]MCB8987828.1 site-2 protease family protein [Ardenticatenaceae bacterium]
MQSGFTLGRLAGIRIKIDWSWLLIFAFLTWNLGVAFGQMHPGWTIALRWSMALIASFLFFIAVLAHELAHSLVAQAQGVPVRSITLFLFGGVSDIQKEPPSPRAEFLITIVGPITSVVLGIILALAGGFLAGSAAFTPGQTTSILSQFSPLVTLLLWLGSINILVGLFNLIPGFPLDGGRLVRSILWAITDDLRRATHSASILGQAIAWLMILSGIAMFFGIQIPFFGAGILNGIWLAFIGWFLYNASVQSYRQVVVQDLLEDVPVTRLMRLNPPTVTADQSVGELVHDRLMATDERAFPVVDDGRFLGLITLEDIRSVDKNAWATTTAREIMTPVASLVTMNVNEDASTAINKLRQQDVRQLPVMEDGRLTGLIRRRDILKWLQLQTAN